MAKSERIIFPDAETMSRKAAQLFIQAAKEAIAARGRFIAALSGGRTSKRTYQLLAEPPFRNQLPWEKIHFFLSDERFVPVESSESNFGLIQKLLFSKIPLPPKNQHPFSVNVPFLPQAARKSEETFQAFFREKEGHFPVFDLILLGMGSDGHAAGLFPGTAASKEKQRWVSFSEKKGGFDRLSLTLPVLNAAKSIVVLVTGEEKAERVARVLKGNAKDLPAGSLHPKDGTLCWMLDQAAASHLRE